MRSCFPAHGLLALLTAVLLALTPTLPLGPGGAWKAAAQAARQDNGVIDETSYESPQYGYTVTWEEPWELGNAASTTSRDDLLTLRGDGGTIFMRGQAAAGEPAELLATEIGTLREGLPQTQVVVNELDAEVPFAVVDGRANRIYLEVRTVAGGDAFVLVSLQTPIDGADDVLADAGAVLLDDEAILTGEREGTDPAATPTDESTETATASATETATETETDTDTDTDTDTETTTETTTETDDADRPSLELADPTAEASTETETNTETDTETATEDDGRGLTLEETPAADEGDAPESAVDGNTYTSPTYDYTFEWDEDIWQVPPDGERSEPRYEAVQLESDTGFLVIAAIEGLNGDAEACLEAEAEINEEQIEGIEDFAPATGGDGEAIAGSDEESAYGVFTFTYGDPEVEDAERLDFVAYIECRTLVEGEAVLDILSISPRALYNDHIERVLAVTDTIELAGAEAETETDTESALDLSTDTATATETETETETETDTATDTATETETTTETESDTDTATGASGVAGTGFTSPTYGFSLDWPSTWEVVDEAIGEDEGRETLVLSNSVSIVTVEALPFTGSLPACVDAAIDEDGADPAYAGLELATTGAGEPFQGSDDETAYAVYLYPGDRDEEFAHFVECRWIVEGESVLVFTQDVPNDQWVDQRQERLDIQRSITLAEEPE